MLGRPLPRVPATFEAGFLLDLPGGGYRVVGRSAPFATREAKAALRGAAQVPAGTTVEVDGQGPGGAGDRVEVHAEGWPSSAAALGTARTFTRPAALRAPDEPGAYEIRYLVGADGTIAQRFPLTVR